jgi:hypothetical protein
VRFALLNASAASSDDLNRLADAFNRGLPAFCADYGLALAEVHAFPGAAAAPDASYTPITLLADLPPDVTGVDAFHDVDPVGAPFAVAALNLVPLKRVLHDPSGRGESAAAWLGHELLEALADPDANRERDVSFTDPATGAVYSQVAEEVCDPVQELASTIVLSDGTLVDFPAYVKPSWFQKRARTTSFDSMGVLHAPLTVAPGGYVIARPAGPSVDVDVMGRRRLVKVHHPVRQARWREYYKARGRSRGRRRGAF